MIMEHEIYMRRALALARLGQGRTWPNPSVGCVIVKDGQIIAEARTADGGRPHAETQALEIAGEKAGGASLYVTLEPCNTSGQTGPCVDAVIAAGIESVFIACADPFQQGHGGLERLEKAGIAVVSGICAEEAQAVNKGFFLRVQESRPLVTAKIATTLDARIATRAGKSQWITGEKSRAFVHQLRAAHDAILVGIGTVLADDPLLTVRIEGVETKQPVRVVIDPSLKIPEDASLLKSLEKAPLWLIVSTDSDQERREKLEALGVKVLLVEPESGQLPVPAILHALAEEGLTRLFVEGGSHTLTAFLKAGLVDELYWFRAPVLFGGDALPAFGSLAIDEVPKAVDFRLKERLDIGQDNLEIWQKRA